MAETVLGSIQELVSKYENDHVQFEGTAYNETEVRVDFLNPMFEALGWDVNNVNNLPQHLREVKHEANVGVDVDGVIVNKKPDYSFRLGTENRFYVEAKKPSVDITKDSNPAFQLRRYGWSGNLKLSVLTNFRDLLIYDCTIRPKEGDNWITALVAHFNYKDYICAFGDIERFLSRDSVTSGLFDEICESLAQPITREPFDEYFLNQIRMWRNALCGDLLENNRIEDEEMLNLFVQRILDRVLFLRICEDRLLENFETMKSVETYDGLRALFEYADDRYDSGLFRLIDDADWAITDDVLIGIFSDLYFPNSPYEFSVVEPHVIGQIYSLFLLEYIAVIDETNFTVIEKPETIDKHGAVNTPKNISDCIVHEALSPVLSGLDYDGMKGIRVADICCGSGNFLVSSFELLCDRMRDYLVANSLRESLANGMLVYTGLDDDYILSFSVRRSVLSDCIFGVDIDPLAVEVAKLGLLIKLLENTSHVEIDAFLAGGNNKVLPNLDLNIKNGNSLIDDRYFAYNPNGINDLELLDKLRIFNWHDEFPRGKFDVIVGNPPYIRVQNMVQYSPEEYDYFRWDTVCYSAASVGTLDKYHLFIERGFELLRQGGVLGFIVPHKFMTIQSGSAMRKYLGENRLVQRIVHFGTCQVFKGRSTYTCILVLSDRHEPSFEIGFVSDVADYVSAQALEIKKYPSERLGEAPWVFFDRRIEQALETKRGRCRSLSEICELFVGMQTSADDVFIIKPNRLTAEFAIVESEGVEYRIEKGVLRDCIKDAQISKYHTIEPNSYLIFPYSECSGRITLIPEDQMAQLFPYALQYLSARRQILDERNMQRTANSSWYAFGRSQSIQKFSGGEHLVWPVLSRESNYVYDSDCVTFTGGGNGPYYGLRMKDGSPLSILYVQALLNHWLLEQIVRSVSSYFRGGYYSHGKQFIEDLPIYWVDFGDESDVHAYEGIVNGVARLMELTSEIQGATPQRRQTIERALRSQQRLLDDNIDVLYGVDEKWVDAL
jgi:methylase of polypeptide subunit release factors